MCHPLVMIFRQIFTDFHNSFTAEKSVKFRPITKQCPTLPTAPKICCHATSRKFSNQHSNLMHFCTVNYVPIKCSYQTCGGNFITSQLIIKMSRIVL